MVFPDAPEMRQMGAKIYRNTIDFPDGLAVMQSGWGRIGIQNIIQRPLNNILL